MAASAISEVANAAGRRRDASGVLVVEILALDRLEERGWTTGIDIGSERVACPGLEGHRRPERQVRGRQLAQELVLEPGRLDALMDLQTQDM